MKHVMKNDLIKRSKDQNLNTVIEIVSNVEHVGFNHKFQDGYNLLQEIDTRFGTTFDVVSCFIKSISQLKDIIVFKSGEAIEK